MVGSTPRALGKLSLDTLDLCEFGQLGLGLGPETKSQERVARAAVFFRCQHIEFGLFGGMVGLSFLNHANLAAHDRRHKTRVTNPNQFSQVPFGDGLCSVHPKACQQ